MSKCNTPTVMHLSVAMMLRMMLREPTSITEIVAETGLTRETVRRWVKALHGKRVIHVAAWCKESDRASFARKFSIGSFQDVHKPVHRKSA